MTPTQWRSLTLIGIPLQLQSTLADVQPIRAPLSHLWLKEGFRGIVKICRRTRKQRQNSAQMLFQTSVSVGDLLKMAFQCAQPDAQTVLFLHLFYCLVVLWDEERKLHSRRCRKYSGPWNSSARSFKSFSNVAAVHPPETATFSDDQGFSSFFKRCVSLNVKLCLFIFAFTSCLLDETVKTAPEGLRSSQVLVSRSEPSLT